MEKTDEDVSLEQLERGIIIDNYFYEFEMKTVYNDFIQILVPKVFFEMPSELRYLKYGLTQPAGYLMMSPGGAIDMGISVIDNFSLESPLVDAIKESHQALHRSNPGCVYDNDYIVFDSNEKEVVVSSAAIQTVDGLIKSYYGHLLTGKQVVAVTLNTPYSDDSPWENVFCQLMKSIRIQYGIHTKFHRF